MKYLFASTAIGLAMALPVAAQDNAANDPMMESDVFVSSMENVMKASELIGMRLYASEAELEGEYAEAETDWEDIGEVSDVLINKEGDVEAVMLDIGGFLGIGEKTIAVNLDALEMIPDTDDEGEYFIVMNGNRAALEEAPEYEADDAMDEAAAETDQATDEAAAETDAAMENAEQETEEAAENTEQAMENAAEETEQAADEAADETEEALDSAAAETEEAADDAAMATEQAADEAGEEVSETGDAMAGQVGLWDSLTAEDLTGERVYGPDGEDVGDIGEVILTDDLKVEKIIVDVGGFLGLGEKPVALEPSQIEIKEGDAGVTVHVQMTEEELEAMETYSE